MLTPSLNTVMTRLLIVAAVLGTIVFFAPAIFAQDGTIQYSETSTDPVRTFVSDDPEGAGIDWDVTGLDAADFSIDRRSGVLMFNSQPDFENPSDREMPDGDDVDSAVDEPGKDNMYQITIRATETSGTTNRALSTTQDFTVEVTNAEDDGVITFDRLQPEIGTEITAELRDGDRLNNTETPSGPIDGGGVVWQWSISKVTEPQKDVEGHWTVVETSDSANILTLSNTFVGTYVPMGDCVDDKQGTQGNLEDQGCNLAQGVTDVDQATARDEGKYLRVKATYTDRRGAGKFAVAVLANKVRAEVSSDNDNVENPDNGSPGFEQGADYTRSVPESTAKGMPVGAAVVATDPNEDTLYYELDDELSSDDGVASGSDASYFSVDNATGQLMVAKTLDYDSNPNRNSPDGKYVIYVRATDPSNESATIKVTVTATAANDAPTIMGSLTVEDYAFNDDDQDDNNVDVPDAPSELMVYEKDDDLKAPNDYTGFPQMPLPGNMPEANSGNDTPGLGASNVFTAGDQDARGQIFWTLRGDDHDDFVLSQTGLVLTGYTGPDEPTALRFVNAPDYENPTDENMDSVYKVTIVATDSAGAEDTHDVTVFVTNRNEAGKATLSETQPLIGQPVSATVSDPDNSVTAVTWQWARSSTSTGPFTAIPGATTDTYVPWKRGDDDDDDIPDDNGMFLRAYATYIDTTSEDDDPMTGTVDERVQMGDDPTGPTAKMATTTKSGDGDSQLYRVMVTSANAVRVPEDAEDVNPVFADAPYVREVVENAETGSIVGLPVAASYSDPLIYKIDNAAANDNKYFEIDPNNGQIRVASMDVADPTPSDQFAVPSDAVGDTGEQTDDVGTTTDPMLDYEGKNSFTLLISATDAKDPGRKAAATVTVNLTNQNEAPYFDKDSREKVQTVDEDTGAVTPTAIPYAENRRTAVVALAAMEPDGDALRWELTGANAGVFMIEDIPDGSGTRDRVELVFKNQPNFEPDGKTYNVTVRATEEMDSVDGGPAKAAELDVMVMVTDIDESGSVEIKWLQPEVGTEQEIIVTDPDVTDAIRTGVTYQWFRSKVANPNRSPVIADLEDADSEWELIEGETESTYTPQGKTAGTEEDEVDEGWYLLVRVTYQDGQASNETSDENEMAIGISANPVQADVADTDNNSPDFQTSKTTRTIPEDTAKGADVGLPVMVRVNEDKDTLTYELLSALTVAPSTDEDDITEANFDLGHFDIDKATGQITLKKTLSYENDVGEMDGEYMVVVRATDPSGEIEEEENRDDILVTIKATDVNEAPGIADGAGDPGLAELEVDEADSSDKDYYVGLGNMEVDTDNDDEVDSIQLNATTTNLYQREEADLVDSTMWPEPIGGDDGDLFEYSVPADARGIGRRLHFKSPPDFENPMDMNRDNVYEVTLTVVDTSGLMGQKNIRITVMNVDEKGKLTIAPAQPHLDGMVVATLTDPDGVESITDWKWASASSTGGMFGDHSVIDGATMGYFIPEDDDGLVGKFLWAMVEYRDGASVEDAPVTAMDERNDDPGSADAVETRHDSDEMLSKATDSAVQEDPSGPDPSDFPGQTIELEVKESTPSTGYVGTPVLMYDPTKAADRQDPRTDVGGPDGSMFVFAEDHDSNQTSPDEMVSYYDAMLSTDLAPQGAEDALDKFGQLALKPVTHLDAEGEKTEYVVEIMDADAANELGVIMVIITVTDVNEAPSKPAEHFGPAVPTNTAPEFQDANGDMATSTTRMVAENTAAGMDIGDPVAAMDADRGDTLSYELGGADAASFAIDAETGQLMTSAALDYETKMEYMVTVTATDSEGETDMIYVTIMVTNVGLDNAYDMDEDGAISRSEVIEAIRDFLVSGTITRDQVIEVIRLFLTG